MIMTVGEECCSQEEISENLSGDVDKTGHKLVISPGQTIYTVILIYIQSNLKQEDQKMTLQLKFTWMTKFVFSIKDNNVVWPVIYISNAISNRSSLIINKLSNIKIILMIITPIPLLLWSTRYIYIGRKIIPQWKDLIPFLNIIH